MKKICLTSLLFAGLAAGLSAKTTTNASAVTAESLVKAMPAVVLGGETHLQVADLPWPNPKSPEPPAVADLPWPNPKSPEPPAVADLPWPNPKSPEPPAIADLPWPNPKSPEPPAVADLPWPNPKSPEPPAAA